MIENFWISKSTGRQDIQRIRIRIQITACGHPTRKHLFLRRFTSTAQGSIDSTEDYNTANIVTETATRNLMPASW